MRVWGIAFGAILVAALAGAAHLISGHLVAPALLAAWPSAPAASEVPRDITPRTRSAEPRPASPFPEQTNIMGNAFQKTKSNWQSLDGKNPDEQTAIFGAGCYWGTEAYMVKKFGDAASGGALEATAVGFMGSSSAKANPSYDEVCSGRTGHVEVLAVKFNPNKVSYRELVKHFFTFHDPTTPNRQGNDVGPQYASVMFTTTEEQKAIATEVKKELEAKLSAGDIKFKGRGGFQAKTVSTQIVPATTFYAAHEEHQRYLESNPTGYCNHGIRFEWDN
mmetsp:Transcript_15874/g.44376  ORF Transcript_15874/g.44376 Transcript_15874/m.44376 type:complete len:277 (-) Transcript_15874:207-1037(-)